MHAIAACMPPLLLVQDAGGSMSDQLERAKAQAFAGL